MTLLQLRRGTAAQWTTANPVLAVGEQGLETDTKKRKTGDGSTAWTGLPYDIVTSAQAAATAPVQSVAGRSGAVVLTAADVSGVATPASVSTALAALVGSAPGTLDTLGELASALTADESAAATLTTLVGTKVTLPALGERQVFVSASGSDSADGRSVATAKATINAAYTALGGNPGVIRLGVGTIPLAGRLEFTTPVSIVGAGVGLTEIAYTPGASDFNALEFLGSVPALASPTTLLTANTAPLGLTLTVASTSGLAVGDWVMVGDDRQPDTPLQPNRCAGEAVRIKSIDSATQVTLWGPIDGTYTTTQNAGIHKISTLQGVTLQGFTMRHTAPGTSHAGAIHMYATLNARVQDVHLSDFDGWGIYAEYDINGRYDFSARDLADDPATNRYGYGFCASGASYGTRVTGTVTRARHAFTVTGITGHRGFPNHITVHDMHGTQTTLSCFDSHAGAQNLSYIGCKATDVPHNGFQARSPSHFEGCTAENCTEYGLVVADALAHGVSWVGGKFRRIGKSGVRTWQSHQTTVSGAVFDQIGWYGIIVSESGSRHTFKGNTFINVAVGLGSGEAIRFEDGLASSGHIVADNTALAAVGPITGDKSGVGKLSSVVGFGTLTTGSTAYNNRGKGNTANAVVDRNGTNSNLDAATTSGSSVSAFKPTAFVAETMPRSAGPMASVSALASGRASFTAIQLDTGVTVNSITFIAGSATPSGFTNWWFVLVDSAGIQRAITADQLTASWSANSAKTLTVTTPFTVATGGLHYLGIMVAATTVPQVVGFSTSALVTGQTPIIGANDTAHTGLTTPASAPATWTLSNAGILAYAGVS